MSGLDCFESWRLVAVANVRPLDDVYCVLCIDNNAYWFPSDHWYMNLVLHPKSRLQLTNSKCFSFFLSLFLTCRTYVFYGRRYERLQRSDYVRNWWRRLIHSGWRTRRLLRHYIDLHNLLHDRHIMSRLRTQGQSIHFHFCLPLFA